MINFGDKEKKKFGNYFTLNLPLKIFKIIHSELS